MTASVARASHSLMFSKRKIKQRLCTGTSRSLSRTRWSRLLPSSDLRFALGRPKFQTRSPNGSLRLTIFRLTSSEQTTKFPDHSALLKWQRKTFDRPNYTLFQASARNVRHANFCKFVAFSTLLRTRTVHSEVSFIIFFFSFIPDSLFFTVLFVVTFERLAKTFQFLKMIHSSSSRSYFNLLFIYTIACDARKYKSSEI